MRSFVLCVFRKIRGELSQTPPAGRPKLYPYPLLRLRSRRTPHATTPHPLSFIPYYPLRLQVKMPFLTDCAYFFVRGPNKAQLSHLKHLTGLVAGKVSRRLQPLEKPMIRSLPKEGVEPSPCCQDGILNPARLPVPPLRPNQRPIIENPQTFVNRKSHPLQLPHLLGLLVSALNLTCDMVTPAY